MPIKTSLVIKDFKALFEAAEMVTGRFGEDLFFRGQPTTRREKMQWKLLPKVFRNLSDDDASPRHYDRGQETDLFLRFCIGAHSRHPSVPDAHDYARWLSLMQHYGLPTRLLDWTHSILVAAFFAVYPEPKPDEDPPVIWALRHNRLHLAQEAPEGARLFRTNDLYINPALIGIVNSRDFKQEKILAVVGEEIDPQMMIQQSCFTFHESDQPLEDFRGPNGKIKPEEILMKFEIAPDAKIRQRFRQHLYAAGIRESTLFPDLRHLASDLERHPCNRAIRKEPGVQCDPGDPASS